MLLIRNGRFFFIIVLMWSVFGTNDSRSAGNLTYLESTIYEDDIEDNESVISPGNSSSLIVNNNVGKDRNGKAIKDKPDLETCRSLEIEADKSFKKLLMIGENFSIPRNESELQVYCKRGKSAMKHVTLFGKCLKPFPRQVLSIIIRGGKRSLREHCNATKGRSEILKHLECVTPETSQIFYTSLEHGFRRLDYIADHIQDDDLLSTICCTFHLIYGQTLDLVRHHCSKSPDSTVKFIKSIVDNIAKDVLELGCSKWSSINSCDAQLSNTMATLRSIQPPNESDLTKRFLIGPIVSIASRLVA